MAFYLETPEKMRSSGIFCLASSSSSRTCWHDISSTSFGSGNGTCAILEGHPDDDDLISKKKEKRQRAKCYQDYDRRRHHHRQQHGMMTLF